MKALAWKKRIGYCLIMFHPECFKSFSMPHTENCAPWLIYQEQEERIYCAVCIKWRLHTGDGVEKMEGKMVPPLFKYILLILHTAQDMWKVKLNFGYKAVATFKKEMPTVLFATCYNCTCLKSEWRGKLFCAIKTP